MKNGIPRSDIFPITPVDFGDGSIEGVVTGGRKNFSILPEAFSGFKQIGVIGWGSQGPAQSLDLHDSLVRTGIKVKVGLRCNSPHWHDAQEAGFTERDGTLGEMFSVINESDLAIILISDSAQISNRREIFQAIRPGTTLGFSHGFLKGYLESVRESFPDEINIIGVCPKGMGPSVRRLYEQGSGINCSFAVEQDFTGNATDIALGWATAIGAPYIFKTTLGMEWRSDLSGERCILLGGAHGIVESLFRFYCYSYDQETSFKMSVENITGPISRAISRQGILGLYNKLADADKLVFNEAYFAAIYPFVALVLEIYDEVDSGNEIRSVEMAGKRNTPMSTLDQTVMWKVGERVRAKRNGNPERINPFTAGIYCAAMMAQIEVLREHGHCWSEIGNETVVEATDSLNPYMHLRGIAHMVDNCSTTARLGSRRWAPRWDYTVMQQILPKTGDADYDKDAINYFLNHPVHKALEICRQMRPPIDISLK